jgi:D-sedoheptulose 7-phosphate isomerase
VDRVFQASIGQAIDLLSDALQADRRVFVFGNGGSAADALHIAAELVGRFSFERPPLPVVALTANQAVLTAWSNDHGFESVFARQIEALGRAGDVAWGLTTSGNSQNVVLGLRRARQLGLRTLGLTGGSGGAVSEHCDVLVRPPVVNTPRVQEVHVVAYHAICAALEVRLFGNR